MTTVWPHIAILAFVTLQRIGELGLARSNTAALLARGAREVAPGHYPLLVAVHAGWLACLWWSAPGRLIEWTLLALFALLQAARVWVIRAMGPRWTTRVIIVPGAARIETGPFRYLSHPNYAVVMAELVLLPLVFGLWWIATLFFALNAVVLAIRITAENKALDEARR
ncbi:MAG: hypothetical protein AVDCRST_MAG91-2653 [uncultured Sphingomonadaceae bacterium]|uniref:Alkylpyrone O-methyltransferase (B. subtilis BpsB) n=1 Tax=uncultured Sphingomonadaceae bacterium TaxID=169976 RepID=A0A6J4TPN9_9SPHN|nr:MAG: hypothetical protein AVDCRST_MAG91-2653 [uncultured Sphingomonadaceae bacterium]